MDAAVNFNQKTLAITIVINAAIIGAAVSLVVGFHATPGLLAIFGLALVMFDFAFLAGRARMRHSTSRIAAAPVAFQRSWAGLVLPGVIFLGTAGALYRFVVSRDWTDLVLAAFGTALGSVYYLRWKRLRRDTT
jgi:hypothetical protein